jgi:hypothetical protein
MISPTRTGLVAKEQRLEGGHAERKTLMAAPWETEFGARPPIKPGAALSDDGSQGGHLPYCPAFVSYLTVIEITKHGASRQALEPVGCCLWIFCG